MSVITPLPSAPSTSDPTTFDAKADAMLGALPTFVTQANQLEVNLTAAAAPGGIMIPYVFDGSTVDTDPGDGKFRIGGATQNAATVWRLDTKSGVGVDVSALLDAMATISTSTIKGQARLQKSADPTKYLLANFTAVAKPSGGGYRNMTVSVIGSSSANPFTDLDACVMTITANGDKGDQGPTSLWTGILSGVTISGSPSLVTFSSIPSGYADLHFRGLVNLSGSSIITAAFSANGSAWTPEVSTGGGVATSTFVDLIIFEYLSSEPTVIYSTNNSGSYSAPAALSMIASTFCVRLSGPLTHVRFSAQSGTMSSGSFNRPRAR